MSIDELELYYRKKDFAAFDALSEALKFSLDPSEQRDTEYLMALRFLAQRRYSGDCAYDEAVMFHKNILQYADSNLLNYKIALAEILFFQNEFNEADKLLHGTLAKARVKEDKELESRCLAMIGNWYLEQNRFKEALQVVQDILRFNDFDILSDKTKSEIYKTLVQTLLRSQEFGSLEEYSQLLLTLSLNTHDIEKEIIARNTLAIVNSIQSNYRIAMGYFLECLDRAISIGYRKSIADSLVNIGTIYANLQNHEEALLRYKTILEDYDDILPINTLAIIYNNVGNIFYLLNNAEQAKLNFEKSLNLATTSSYQEMITLALTQISRVHRMEGNLEEALVLAEQARFLMLQQNETTGLQINTINLAYLHADLGDLDSAVALAKLGKDSSLSMGDEINAMQAIRLLSSIYADLRDYETAYQFQKEYVELQDKVVKEQSRLHTIDIEIRYDIREKQKQIEHLQKENAFQGKLIEQSEQIAQQNTQLVFANEELQQFAYIVSHDLKEPLRMIASYSQLIMFRYKDVVDENFQTYLDFMSEGVTRMNALLDGLLQYGTVGKEKEDKEEVEIEDIIDAAQFNLKLLIRETNAEIEVGKMPIIIAHPSRMIQLFQNLMNNALKFSRADVRPHIKITCNKRGKIYHFRVQDNGIGIEEEHRERVFAIFQRLHTRKQYEGTGIGLSICQKIVQHLGGNIWIEDAPEGGTVFCFDLPILTN